MWWSRSRGPWLQHGGLVLKLLVGRGTSPQVQGSSNQHSLESLGRRIPTDIFVNSFLTNIHMPVQGPHLSIHHVVVFFPCTRDTTNRQKHLLLLESNAQEPSRTDSPPPHPGPQSSYEEGKEMCYNSKSPDITKSFLLGVALGWNIIHSWTISHYAGYHVSGTSGH